MEKTIVDKSLERKTLHGPSHPVEENQEEEELDLIINRFEELLDFDSDENDDFSHNFDE
jgi:hypothetical protein